HPPRYDYRLTPKGRDLWTVATAMRQWGDRWAAPAGPPVETVHRTCGHRAEIVPTCSACGEPVAPQDLEPVLGPGATDPDLVPPRRAAPVEAPETCSEGPRSVRRPGGVVADAVGDAAAEQLDPCDPLLPGPRPGPGWSRPVAAGRWSLPQAVVERAGGATVVG